MRVFFTNLFLFLFVFFYSPFLSKAEKLILDTHQLYHYATFLYSHGEYYRAITEFQKLLFYFPKNQYYEQAEISIGKAYIAGGDLESAIQYWKSKLDKIHVHNAHFFQLQYFLALSLLDKDSFQPFRYQKNNIQKAIKIFQELPSHTDLFRRTKDFSYLWKHHDLSSQKKSTAIAGTLSTILPGSGSFYAKRYREGVYAFFLTTLFALATHESIENDNHGLASLFGFFTITFYGGNIYTAVNSVHKYNDHLESHYLNNLRSQYQLWFNP